MDEYQLVDAEDWSMEAFLPMLHAALSLAGLLSPDDLDAVLTQVGAGFAGRWRVVGRTCLHDVAWCHGSGLGRRARASSRLCCLSGACGAQMAHAATAALSSDEPAASARPTPSLGLAAGSGAMRPAMAELRAKSGALTSGPGAPRRRLRTLPRLTFATWSLPRRIRPCSDSSASGPTVHVRAGGGGDGGGGPAPLERTNTARAWQHQASNLSSRISHSIAPNPSGAVSLKLQGSGAFSPFAAQAPGPGAPDAGASPTRRGAAGAGGWFAAGGGGGSSGAHASPQLPVSEEDALEQTAAVGLGGRSSQARDVAPAEGGASPDEGLHLPLMEHELVDLNDLSMLVDLSQLIGTLLVCIKPHAAAAVDALLPNPAVLSSVAESALVVKDMLAFGSARLSASHGGSQSHLPLPADDTTTSHPPTSRTSSAGRVAALGPRSFTSLVGSGGDAAATAAAGIGAERRSLHHHAAGAPPPSVSELEPLLLPSSSFTEGARLLLRRPSHNARGSAAAAAGALPHGPRSGSGVNLSPGGGGPATPPSQQLDAAPPAGSASGHLPGTTLCTIPLPFHRLSPRSP